MRVQFIYSQEDIVDGSLRFLARSRSVRLMRRKRTAWLALLVWLLVFVFFRFSFHGAIVGIVAALIVVITDPFTYNYELRKNLRKIARERYGEENEFVCEVELLPEGLKTSAETIGENIHGATEWETIEERTRFIALAREYMNRAGAAGKLVK